MFPSREQIAENDQKKITPEIAGVSHMILVRSIWNQIRGSIPEDLTSFSSIDAEFSVKLSKNDVIILEHFIESKSDVSAEVVNEIFSRFLVPVPVKHDENFKFSYKHLLFLLPIIIFFICRKLGIFLFIIVVILCTATYELYVKAVAKRHALINRLPTIPEECLPYSKQSIKTKIYGLLPFVNYRDDCEKYFELLMTHTFADLRPDKIIGLVLGDLAENVFSVAGGSIGRFYASLNSYVPFFIAIPITIFFIYCLPYLFRKAFEARKRKKRRPLTRPKAKQALKQD